MRMIEFRGVLIPAPPPIVQLSCEPGFTGRVVVELKDGEFVKQYPVRKEEMFCSFETLLEIAKQAGYQVIPPTSEISRADSYTNT